MKINGHSDSADLLPEMAQEQARDAISWANTADSYTVCARGYCLTPVVEMIKSADTAVGCVLDFPHGYGGQKPNGRGLPKTHCVKHAPGQPCRMRGM